MPSPLQVDLAVQLTLKVVSESRVTWATSVPILIFLGLSVLDVGPMQATDRRQTDRETDVRRASSLNAPYSRGGGIMMMTCSCVRLQALLIRISSFLQSDGPRVDQVGHLTLRSITIIAVSSSPTAARSSSMCRFVSNFFHPTDSRNA